MRVSRSGLWLGFVLAVLLSACAGNGTVYVGVAGPGPWVGYPGAYPGVPYGRPMGYPPYRWDDDDQEDEAQEEGLLEEDGQDQAGTARIEADVDTEEAGRADPTG